MNNIKGIIFAIESLIASSKKGVLSNKIAIDPEDIFPLIEKLKDAIEEYEQQKKEQEKQQYKEQVSEEAVNSDDELINAQKLAFKMKKDANEYADGVLSRLQLLVTKLQTNVIKVEKNIVEGRKLIEQHKIKSTKGENNEA